MRDLPGWMSEFDSTDSRAHGADFLKLRLPTGSIIPYIKRESIFPNSKGECSYAICPTLLDRRRLPPRRASGATAVHAQATKLLPNDTEMIVTLNLKQILNSEIAKANKTLLDIAKGKIEEMLDDKGFGKYLKKADFDLFRDLSSITVGGPDALAIRTKPSSCWKASSTPRRSKRPPRTRAKKRAAA